LAAPLQPPASEKEADMTQSEEMLFREALHGQGFISRIGEMISKNLNTSIIYGAPIERDGVSIIPVAKVRYGFGGGTGKKQGQEGHGGGGGAQVLPLGYIEVSGGRAAFRRIGDPSTLLGLVALGGFSMFLVLRGLRRLFRG
jgi:hypothetical protein